MSANADRYPSLQKNDEGLQKELESLLTKFATGDPYARDGAFARNITKLPVGLRAMAATHWLDISLTLDSITWHFGNFGEPAFVQLTESGLLELGLVELAKVFDEAKQLMMPLQQQRLDSECESLDEFLESLGLLERAESINRRAWDIDNLGAGKSVIYESWLRYTRAHPENVFDAQLT